MSANAAEMLAWDGDLLGRQLADVLGPKLLSTLR